MVEHEVDDDAGDGDVEPEGEGVAGDEAMLIEFFEEGAAEGDEDERDDDDGEDGVGEEQGEVDRANQTLSLEGDVADAVVVDEVGDEEGAGDDERGEHEFLVELGFAVADGGVATGEENGAGTIEGGVEGGVGEHDVVTFRFEWMG